MRADRPRPALSYGIVGKGGRVTRSKSEALSGWHRRSLTDSRASSTPNQELTGGEGSLGSNAEWEKSRVPQTDPD